MTIFYILNITIRIAGLTWVRFRKSAWNLYSIFAVGGSFITAILLLSDFENRAYLQIHKLFLVATVLLLIPRNNQLDQLFKTGAASLPAIGTLLATWFVLFLVFAIAMTQTFGLTRFASQETGNLNLRSVPKALILLFRMSTGEGWNQIMVDYATVLPPFCTTSNNFLDSDCGSTAWARVLFIAWNILSMYIFVNLFLSLIYESFSYVYQRSSGLSIISREEIRRFKEAWSEFDPNGTGFISKDSFPRFLGELSGVFDMSIYPGDFSVKSIINQCKVSNPQTQVPVSAVDRTQELDLRKLNELLSRLPVAEIRQRRTRRNMFCEEVLVSADPDRGIGFTTLLMILAQHKVINDNKALRLEEFLRRRARLQRVEEAVRRSVVFGFFDMLHHSHKFRRARAERLGLDANARLGTVPQLQMPVPEIIVEDDDEMRRRASAVSAVGSVAKKRSSRPTLAIQIPQVHVSEGSVTSGSDSGRPGGMALRTRSGSIQRSPRMRTPSPSGSHQLSPLRQSESFGARGSPGELWMHRRGGLDGSGPPSPLTPDGRPSGDYWGGRLSADREGGGGRERAVSSVSSGAQDMLQSFDESAWGESIRRSATLRREDSR